MLLYFCLVLVLKCFLETLLLLQLKYFFLVIVNTDDSTFSLFFVIVLWFTIFSIPFYRLTLCNLKLGPEV